MIPGWKGWLFIVVKNVVNNNNNLKVKPCEASMHGSIHFSFEAFFNVQTACTVHGDYIIHQQ